MPRAHASQFRRRLVLAALTLTLAVAVLGVTGYLRAQQSQDSLEHVGHSHRQLSSARAIAAQARQWTSQLRDVELGADPSQMRAEIHSSRAALDAALVAFGDATREYTEYANDNEEETEELRRVAELETLTAELGGISDEVVRGRGWTPEFRAELGRVSAELETLTAAIEADELGEVEATMEEARASARQTTVIAAALLVLGLVVTVLVMTALSWRLRDAISKILDAAGAVARGDLEARARIDGEDEFAELGDHFDKMVAELDASLRAREAAAAEARVLAREAGIAQITTGVLHNIGNALNSVNISLELVADSGIDARLTRVAQVGHMLGAHEQDLERFLSQDPRGSKLPRYLAVLAPELEHDAETFSAELGRLRERVDHVIRILRSYQEHGITRLDEEAVEPAQLLSFAIEVALSGTRQRRYEIDRKLSAPERVILDKHRTLEILINLVRNAGDALDEAIEAGDDDPRIELTVEHDPDERTIQFIVRDNGVGIDADSLEQIFVHGFTTKGNHGSGFGLHASANAAVEMGGRLHGESQGRGHGAVFTLELPLREAARAPGWVGPN